MDRSLQRVGRRGPVYMDPPRSTLLVNTYSIINVNTNNVYHKAFTYQYWRPNPPACNSRWTWCRKKIAENACTYCVRDILIKNNKIGHTFPSFFSVPLTLVDFLLGGGLVFLRERLRRCCGLSVNRSGLPSRLCERGARQCFDGP